MCTLQVCKAWRVVIKQPTLFTRIGMRTGHWASDGVRVSSANAMRLVEWLPDVTVVQSLKLHVGDKHNWIAPDVTKKILPRFTGLTSLSLDGKKISGALLAHLAKQPFAANLVSFELGGDCTANNNEAIPLLRQASRLEALTISLGYAGNQGFLSSLASSWRTARGGAGTPLLRSLVLTGWSSSCKILSGHDFSALPELFPELEKLDCSLEGKSQLRPPPQSLQRLSNLTVHALMHAFGTRHLTTEECGHMLCSIFLAAPNLEKLSIHHGDMHVSGQARKAGKRADPYPGIQGALAELPQTLTSLVLGQMTLSATDLDMHPGLPALQRLVLSRCGPEAIGLANAAVTDRTKCPWLEAKRVYTAESNGKLVCLDPEVESRAKAAEEAAASEAAAKRAAALANTSIRHGSRPVSSLEGF